MATLEKIRKRSTLLLIVVGVALLAFIIGDFFTSGRTLFGAGTTIAKVGDKKIDVQDFQRRNEEASQQMQQQQPDSKVDPALMQAQVLQGMIQESLINEEMDRLGITVTDTELSKAMTGASAHPYMLQFARQMGAESPDQVYDYAFNPTKYNLPTETAQQLQQMWLNQEKQMTQMLKIQKLQAMLSGALTANELDAKEYYAGNASTSHMAYVSKNFSMMPDDEYPVSDSELRAAYEKEKEAYRVDDETRRANFIVVNVSPSSADKAEGQALVDSTIAKLRTTPAIDAVAGDTNFGVNRVSSTAAKVSSPVLRAFLTDSAAGAVAQISYIDDEFTVAKLIGKKSAVDSVNLDIIQFQGTAAARDSLLAALNSGKTAADVVGTPGVLDSKSDMWQTLASAPDNDIKTRILEAGNGYFIADSAANMASIIRVNSKKAPVTIYDYATVNYKVYPSDATVEKLNDDLQAFVSGITKADSLTMSKAIAAGYTLQPATVTANSYMIGNVPYTRNVVKWVMDAKAGEVSPILQDNQNDHLIVVALDEIVKPGYMPLSDENINSALTRKVRNDKKAAAIIAQIKGKATDVNGYGQLLGSEVDSTEVTFGQMYIPGIGVMESALLGQVPVSEKGKVSEPVQGNNAVYVYTVYDVDNQSRPYDYDENAARFNQQYGAQAVMQNLIGIMMEKEKVENNTLKFYNE
ncbi:SurA N-terminal domain-containing protein [uncultured Muribaculum sp.]|uniref:SurA N-terminal domain-containing protein n=1 Tax=uncultured Muribaculum sp. TaxID=1918613 RepID=UPI0025CB7C05|nr:SurA N-terminal domain-containing protein [uncultured Muribaculum sp.]